MYSLNVTTETLISFVGSDKPNLFITRILAYEVRIPRCMRVTN